MRKYESMSDRQLIFACRKQEQAAWDVLVARYERLVYTIPRRYGLRPDEVDDVFQSVWLLLLQHLHTLQQPERVSAWLVTTARRECWKRRRGAAYQREKSVAPHDLPERGQSEGPEELVLRYERQLAVRRAIQQLGDRCRRLLHLLYYEVPKPAYAEIAASLNMAVGSIGAIRARCLKKISQTLEL